MPTDEPPETNSQPEGHEALAQLLAGYVDRLNAGEILDRERILKDHPEHGSALLEQLEVFFELTGSSTPDVPLGTLGDYELLRQIGRGGMGVVYEAWQNSMNRKVALKVLPAGIAADSKACLRFMREAQAAGKLSHPNIVAVHAMGVDENTPYYAMEMVEGETLAEILRKLKPTARHGEAKERAWTSLAGLLGKERVSAGAVTVDSELKPDPELVQDVADPEAGSNAEGITPAYCRRLAESFAGVADGIHYAHQNGVIHRDIKPSNLMLDKRGKLRVLDFGLARLEGEQSLTVTGDFLGTVLYVSPEQAMVRRVAVDHRTDIYSLGATLYEMLTWRPPFEGKSSQDTLGQIIFRDPKPLRRANPRIPRNIETIVLKCLRKDPKDRYATAEVLAQDLRRFTSGQPIEARPQPTWERVARRVWRYKTRLAVAVVFLALLAILGPILLRPRGIAIRSIWKVPSRLSVNAVSPDNSYLLYSTENDDLGIYKSANGSRWQLVPRPPLSMVRPAGGIFSPDGREVAYVWWNENDFWEIRRIALDGSERHTVYRKENVDAWLYAWSPDGRHILAAVEQGGDTFDIVMIPVRAGSIRALGTLPIRRWPESMCFSPNGDYIALCALPTTGSSNDDIFLLPTDEGLDGSIAIVEHPAEDVLWGFAPEGRRILFQSDRSGNWDAWAVDIDIAGGKPRGDPQIVKSGLGPISPLGLTADGSLYYSTRVSMPKLQITTLDLEAGKVVEPPKSFHQGVGVQSNPAWSPDGEFLAYVSWRGVGSQRIPVISIRSLRTGEHRRIVPQLKKIRGSLHSSIRWSPDGRFLLTSGSDTNAQRGIYTIDVETGKVNLIKKQRFFSSPEWARGGTAILYDDWDKGESPRQLRIVVYDLERGSEREVVTVWGMGSYSVSPDGTLLAFCEWEREPKRSSLKVVPIDGGEAKVLLPPDTEEFRGGLVWTPDGRQLLFLTSKIRTDFREVQLWCIPAAGGTPRSLGRSTAFHPYINERHLHPDGRRLAFVTIPQETKNEVWVMENFLPPFEGSD